MGKFKKWTEQDTALFKNALSKTGQVIIQIQSSTGIGGVDDFDRRKVNIIEKLTVHGYYHQHEYEIKQVPHIIHLTYTPNKNYIVEKVSV